MRRPCDICGSVDVERLHDQRFVTFDDASGLAGYRVVACKRCGFVFADGIPEQDVFDRYYREMSKYEPRDSQWSLSGAKRHNYETIVDALAARFPDRTTSILDVGSAGGDLLSVFKERGYESLTGFDPSPACVEDARSRYGIHVTNAPISQMRSSGKRYELIVLSGVLEHLRDLQATLRTLVALLEPGGHMYFCVPDALRLVDYIEAPYQHLSLEHINFFSASTLSSLMGTVGLRMQDRWESTLRVGTMFEPDLNATFAGVSHASTIAYDGDGATALGAYCAASARLQDRLWTRVADLAASRRPLLVWGVGSLTMSLLADERFASLAIDGYVDANKQYWRKTIRGVPILSPDEIANRDEMILIASFAYESEILAEIRERHGYRNPVVRLFSEESQSHSMMSMNGTS